MTIRLQHSFGQMARDEVESSLMAAGQKIADVTDPNHADATANPVLP
jgi:hypothetical protein